MKLTVIGAGCWGLTLAWLLTDNFDRVTIWGREQDLSEDLIKNKHASKPLEVQLKDKVEITSNLSEAIKDADIILNVVATSGTRDVCEKLKKAGIKKHTVLYSKEEPIKPLFTEDGRHTPGSVSFVPSAAGLMIAGKIIRDLAEI